MLDIKKLKKKTLLHTKLTSKEEESGTSLVVQWLRLCLPVEGKNAGQGTKISYFVEQLSPNATTRESGHGNERPQMQ